MRNPYVTGAYVTGASHYGREDLIDLLLRGQSRACWVVGNRRIGKTSLLRQLEQLARQSDRLVPVFWDMQGCGEFARLGSYLADVVRDNADRFALPGVSVELASDADLLVLLANLRRQVLHGGRELLLLCDETEVLIHLARSEPEAMQRLHRELTGGAGLRVIMTSTRQIYRMHDACRDWPTSSFLAGFDMSRALGSLDQAAAQALIRQAQAPEGERVQAEPEQIAAICHATNNHPLLLQLLCSRLFDDGRLQPLTEAHLRVDPILAGFFEHDFRQLTALERSIVLAVHQAHAIDEAVLQQFVGDTSTDLTQPLRDLEALGYLRHAHGHLAIGNLFLANWLATDGAFLKTMPASQTSDAAMRRIFARQQDQDAGSLVAQLNARRARLVDLEAVRAREFLAVSPQVLDEIEQLQTEIGELRSLLDRRQAR